MSKCGTSAFLSKVFVSYFEICLSSHRADCQNRFRKMRSIERSCFAPASTCEVSQHVETLNARGSSGLGETTHWALAKPAKTILLRYSSCIQAPPIWSTCNYCVTSPTFSAECRRWRRKIRGNVRERKDGVCVPLACMEMNEYIPPSLHEFTASEGPFHISLLLRPS